MSLLGRNFLFWQRGSTSVDGRSFMSMYQISEVGEENDLPLVGIVDPRTGGIVFTLKVRRVLITSRRVDGQQRP